MISALIKLRPKPSAPVAQKSAARRTAHHRRDTDRFAIRVGHVNRFSLFTVRERE